MLIVQGQGRAQKHSKLCVGDLREENNGPDDLYASCQRYQKGFLENRWKAKQNKEDEEWEESKIENIRQINSKQIPDKSSGSNNMQCPYFLSALLEKQTAVDKWSLLCLPTHNKKRHGDCSRQNPPKLEAPADIAPRTFFFNRLKSFYTDWNGQTVHFFPPEEIQLISAENKEPNENSWDRIYNFDDVGYFYKLSLELVISDTCARSGIGKRHLNWLEKQKYNVKRKSRDDETIYLLC